MKKYIFIALVAFTSCTKLDLKPTDIIDPVRAFRNVSDVNLGIIGVYAGMDYTPISMSATASDEATFPVENTVGNSDAFRWLYNPSSGSVTTYYTEAYRAIDRANRTLAAMNTLTFSAADSALASRYRGELLALRGYLHFDLLRTYGSAYQAGALGVPYMKESVIGYPQRDNFETVIANAKADLAQAKNLIPTTFNDKSRFTRLAVAATQARIALYEKSWADAITYATEVITAAPLATRAQFPGVWTDVNENEVIFKLKRAGTTDSRVGDFFYRQTGGIVLYAPSFKLIGTFDQVNDVRFPAYIRFDATRTGTRSPYLVNKYIGGTSSTPGLADIKLFRTAEMYLIRAEARAESTGDGAADLNALRAARISNYVNMIFVDKNALIDAIMNERFKELALEGHRFFDLRRRGLPVQRTAQDAANASGAVLLNPNQAQYAFPIPANEVLINKNTVQNPNY